MFMPPHDPDWLARERWLFLPPSWDADATNAGIGAVMAKPSRPQDTNTKESLSARQ